MNAQFLLENTDVTPLTEGQKKACADMLASFNDKSPVLCPIIYIQETLHGHIAIIKRNIHIPYVDNRVYLTQCEVAAKYRLRWLSADGEKVSFGLPH